MQVEAGNDGLVLEVQHQHLENVRGAGIVATLLVIMPGQQEGLQGASVFSTGCGCGPKRGGDFKSMPSLQIWRLGPGFCRALIEVAG